MMKVISKYPPPLANIWITIKILRGTRRILILEMVLEMVLAMLLLIFVDSSIWKRLHSWNSRKAWKRSWPHLCKISNWFRTLKRHRSNKIKVIMIMLVTLINQMVKLTHNATLLDLLERILTMIKLLRLKYHHQLHLQLKHSLWITNCIFHNQQPPAICLNFFHPVIPKPTITVIPASASVDWFDSFDYWLLLIDSLFFLLFLFNFKTFFCIYSYCWSFYSSYFSNFFLLLRFIILFFLLFLLLFLSLFILPNLWHPGDYYPLVYHFYHFGSHISFIIFYLLLIVFPFSFNFAFSLFVRVL